MTKLKSKLTNTQTVVSIVGLIVMVTTIWMDGVPVDKIQATTIGVCTLLSLMGFFNDTGMKTTTWNK